MAFEAKQLDATLINNNTEYQEGDALQPSAINDIVEGVLHNQGNSGGSGLTKEEKEKLNIIKNDGNGDKYLADDGTYKEVAGGSSVTVDSELSTESENPVQNRVVTEALNGKLDIPTPNPNKLRVVTMKTNNTVSATLLVGEPKVVGANNGLIPMYQNYNTSNDVPTSRLVTGTPLYDGEAANKKYVDDNKGTKLYKHIISGKLTDYNNTIFDFELIFYSTRSDAVGFDFISTGGDGNYKNYIFLEPEDVICVQYAKTANEFGSIMDTIVLDIWELEDVGYSKRFAYRIDTQVNSIAIENTIGEAVYEV